MFKEPTNPPSPEDEKPEYDFETGVREATQKIRQLSKSQDLVVVAVCGSDTEVGKTTLTDQLAQFLKKADIPCVIVSDIDDINVYTRRALTAEQQISNNQKGAIIIGAASALPTQGLTQEKIQENIGFSNQWLAEHAKKAEINASKIDLRIYIYRPDKPFRYGEEKMADIVIRNDQAVDKSHRY